MHGQMTFRKHFLHLILKKAIQNDKMPFIHPYGRKKTQTGRCRS